MCATRIYRLLRVMFLTGLASIAGENLVNAQDDVSFARRDFRVGDGPHSVTVGDFNGDGRSDLATANAISDNVSILLGNGDGTFRSAPDVTVGDYPSSVTVGAFNGDGRPDLATANYLSSTVSILLGRGDGTFRSAPEVTVDNGSISVTVGDFNRDGRSDLATANAISDNVSILLGNGDGTFQRAPDITVGDGPFSIAVGDFNRDGRPDLVTANRWSSNVSILLGNSNGTFRSAQEFAVGLFPASVTVEDFNADGRVDLAVASFTGCYETYCEPGTVSILLGRGDGTFREAQDFEVGVAPESITVGDFNRDGRPDPAIADIISDTLSILIGRGDGTFEEAQDFGVGDRPFGITVGDFNADGRPDLAVANFNSNTVSILLNTSSRVVNNFVSFSSLPSTFVTSPDTKGCPAGFAGTFRFSARLTNRPSSPALEDLTVRVTALTNGNLVQNADGGPAGVGARVPVPQKLGYADGVLSPKESVEVPFVICLKKLASFRLLVDVVEDSGE